MGRTSYLGEFEELILTMVLILEDNAYGNTIVKAIKEHQNRDINLSSVHITLYRLEEKGFLESRMSDSTSARGGKRKRLFYLTPYASKALNELATLREQLRFQIPEQALNWNKG